MGPLEQRWRDRFAPPPGARADRLGRGFRALWFASALGDLATGSVLVAVPLLAAALTRDPVLIGGLTAATLLPWLLFGIPAGVLVDRMDRRTAMVWGNLVRAGSLAVLALLVAAHHAGLGPLFAVAFLLGAAETVYDCAARAALTSVVAVTHVDRANSLLVTTRTVAASFLGAPLAGTLFAVAAALPFGTDAAAFALGSGLVLTLPRLRARDGRVSSQREDERLRRQWIEGVVLIWRDSELRGLWLVSASVGFAGEVAQSVTVLFTLQVLHLPGRWFGLFTSAAAAGAVLGGAVANRLSRRFGRGRALTGALVGYGVSLAGIGLAGNAWQAAALYAAGAGAVAVWNVLSMSIRQLLVPSEVFGRFHGSWRTLVWGSAPAGAVMSGLIASQLGLRAPWLAGAALLLPLLVVAPRLLRRIDVRTSVVPCPPPVLGLKDTRRY